MGAPDVWGTSHDDAVWMIVGVGNDMLDALADLLDGICAAAAAEAESLRAEADAIEPIDPEGAAALRDEADAIEAAAAAECLALAAATAEEGSQILLGMCGNRGQESIIGDAMGDFMTICFECVDEAVAELGAADV